MLLFETALNMEVNRMVDDVGPILLLAVVAVLVATVAIGGALAATASVPLAAYLMLGSIVATTDPVTVIAIFRDLGAPARLSQLVEGEKVFSTTHGHHRFCTVARHAHRGAQAERRHSGTDRFRNFTGGVIKGHFGARVIIALMRRLLDLRRAQGRSDCASECEVEKPHSPSLGLEPGKSSQRPPRLPPRRPSFGEKDGAREQWIEVALTRKSGASARTGLKRIE